jgi:hypothetical protein
MACVMATSADATFSGTVLLCPSSLEQPLDIADGMFVSNIDIAWLQVAIKPGKADTNAIHTSSVYMPETSKPWPAATIQQAWDCLYDITTRRSSAGHQFVLTGDLNARIAQAAHATQRHGLYGERTAPNKAEKCLQEYLQNHRHVHPK